MPKKMTEEKLEALKAHLHQDQHHLDAGQRQTLGEQLADLERQLAVQLPVDTDDLENRLLAWEAKVAVEHPLLASIVRDAIQKLSSMGI
ncbi:MAG TPA: DUF4404 family protein [Moraxellaceae bacterium]